MSMNGTAIANQRYTMIADILPVLDDKKGVNWYNLAMYHD